MANPFNLRCPACNRDDSLTIECTTTWHLTATGCDVVSDCEWDRHDAARCEDCEWHGIVNDLVVYDPRKDEQ